MNTAAQQTWARVITTVLIFSGLVFWQADIGHSAGCDQSSFASGAGTNSDPFLVANESQFRNIKMCDGVSKVFSVRANLDLGGPSSPFIPFGASDTSQFLSEIRGEVFDGTSTLSAEITGLYVEADFAALIAYGGTGTKIRNMNLFGEVQGRKRAGAVIAHARSQAGTSGQIFIENVNSSVDVYAPGTAVEMAGGLVGSFLNTSVVRQTLVISSSQVIYRNAGSVIVESGSYTYFSVGGLVGYVNPGANGADVLVSDATVDTIISVSTGSASVGGLIGLNYGADVEINRSGSYSLIQTYTTLISPLAFTGGKVGGLIGNTDRGGSVRINESVFSGLIRGQGQGAFGGFFGVIYTGADPMDVEISNSYTVGTIIQDSKVLDPNRRTYIGGLAGQGSNKMTISNVLVATQLSFRADNSRVGALFGAGTYTYDFTTANLYYNTSTEASSTSVKVGPVISGTQGTVAGGVAIGNLQQADANTFTGFSNAIWGYCPNPYLLWQGPEGCKPQISGALVTPSGDHLEVFFTLPVNPVPGSGERYPEVSSVFTVRKNGTTLLLSGAISPSTTSRSVVIPLPGIISGTDALEFSYQDPSATDESQAFAMEAAAGGADVPSKGYRLTANMSAAQLLATFGSQTSLINSISLPLTCTGSCGPANSYTYVASITPAGGSTTTISGTATSATTTLSFTALSPNVAHTIRASVTYNGQTSATASTTVTTARPIATISSVVVTETTATLGVGCTNCGASPDSYTISATPVAGGSAITSNTSVISGLSSETSYSFAVVIAYAGTTSSSVNWQSNPVRTLPYSPNISAISPSSGPLSGANITVTGTNFSTSNQVTFAGSTVSFTIVNSTTITFIAPSRTAGSVDLAIRNEVGTGTLANAFTYVAGPSITTTSPAVGTVNGGTIVTITGTDLATATEVRLGSVTVSFSVVADTKIRFTTPASTAGVVSVGVTTVGGTDTEANAFEYTTSALVPVVSSITPTAGTTAGGTTVTVTGQYLSGSYSDSVSAAIDGVSGSSVVVIDDSTLTFVTPAHAAAASLDVTILVGGELGTLIGVFSYTAPVSNNSSGGSNAVAYTGPEIIDFSIRVIYADGGKVTITGKRLGSISSMKLGGVNVTLMDNTDTSATFETGDLPIGVWDLYLANSYGQLTFQQAIQVITPQLTGDGELLGYKWTLKFIGNSRVLNSDQVSALNTVAKKYGNAETVVCWGYTTAEAPKQWAITHATARAEAACSLIAKQLGVKTVVRLRYGVEKSWAMRAALQFWKQEN